MIDFNKTRQYTLSIRLSTDGFCFAVHNPQAVNEYTFQPYRIDTTKSVVANLKVAVKELNMLRHTYGAVNILLVNTPYTLVPIEFYAEQYEREFYQQNIASSTSNATIIHNVVADEQMVVVFAIENQLHKYITTQFPKAVIHAGISPLINFGFERSSMTNKRYCLLHLHKHAIDFLCYDKTSPFCQHVPLQQYGRRSLLSPQLLEHIVNVTNRRHATHRRPATRNQSITKGADTIHSKYTHHTSR